MKGGAGPSAFVAVSFPNSKKVPIYFWVARESFQSSDGEAQPRIYDLPTTFCTITKPLFYYFSIKTFVMTLHFSDHLVFITSVTDVKKDHFGQMLREYDHLCKLITLRNKVDPIPLACKHGI